MTKFEELMELITRNKNKSARKVNDKQDDDDIQLEVSGNESTRGPLVASANEELDPDIIDLLYTKPRNIPNRGENATPWDADY